MYWEGADKHEPWGLKKSILPVVRSLDEHLRSLYCCYFNLAQICFSEYTDPEFISSSLTFKT